MKNKKIIFLKYSLLEEIEMSKKGNLDSDQILTLINKKKYKLEEAVIFKEKLEGEPLKSLVNEIITIKDIEESGYDLYMDTVIVDDTAYRVEEGFKGTLIEVELVQKPIVKKEEPKLASSEINDDEFKKKEKTSEQLLADFMLGL